MADNTMKILVGRKEIANHVGCTWGTIRRWRDSKNFPIRVYPGGKPCLFVEEYEAWKSK